MVKPEFKPKLAEHRDCDWIVLPLMRIEGYWRGLIYRENILVLDRLILSAIGR